MREEVGYRDTPCSQKCLYQELCQRLLVLIKMQKEYRVDLHGVEDGEDDEGLGASKVNPEAGQQQECCEP